VPGLIAKYGTRYNGRNEETGESYPLSEYVKRFVLPAVTGAVAQIPSLEVNKKLDVLAVDIRKRLMESLRAEGLDDSIDISSVLIGNIKLPKVITDAQNLTVKANSELTAATKKVATAEQEALRIQKINSALTDRYLEMQRIDMLKEAARNSKGWIMDASKQSIMFNPN
jgi:regulator of protease activity HflC (stomatin/prohibitin superfamily)